MTSPDTDLDRDANALVRAHLVATLVWCVVVGALGILVGLQLLNPGVFGDAPWASVGRLRFARDLAIRLGLFGNLAAIGIYEAVGPLLRAAQRWRFGAVALAVLNLAVGVPAVALAWMGILPPARVLESWFLLASAQSAELMAFMMIGSSIRLVSWPPAQQKLRPFDRARMVLVGAGGGFLLAMMTRLGSLMVASWSFELLANITVVWGAVLGLRVLPRTLSEATPSASPSVTRLAWGGSVLMTIAVVLLAVAPLLGDASDDGPNAMTQSEQRGRAVFVREGCATCHQAPWNHSVGPDLYREFGARSADWHYTHLFDPRSVSPTSVMPSFARYFEGAPDQPKQDARDLVAYLETLGRKDELSTAPNLAKAPPPSRARRAGDVPALPAGDRAAGMKLFGTYCIGCHGVKGEGDGPGAAGLRPKPANLAAHRYSTEQVAFVLWNGVAGSAMPAWRDRSREEIASLIAAVQSFGETAVASHGSTAATTPEMMEIGARVYAANCSQCHGERGGGDGFSAASLPMAPANFQRQQPTLDYALRAIANGIEGTPMAPWTTRVSEQELLAVAQYVRSFYQGGAK